VLLALLTQGGHHLQTLSYHLLGRLDQRVIQRLLLRLFLLPFAPQLPVQVLCCLPCRAQTRATDLLHVPQVALDHRPGALHEKRESTRTLSTNKPLSVVW
jgi:hypothetical protein